MKGRVRTVFSVAAAAMALAGGNFLEAAGPFQRGSGYGYSPRGNAGYGQVFRSSAFDGGARFRVVTPITGGYREGFVGGRDVHRFQNSYRPSIRTVYQARYQPRNQPRNQFRNQFRNQPGSRSRYTSRRGTYSRYGRYGR